MNELEKIEHQITKALLLVFVAPFVFAYWTDYLLIDLLSLFLISQSKLCSKPTIRGTVLVQIGLYLYTIIYLFAPAQFYEKEIPTSVIALGTLFYLFVAFKSFKAAKLLSPILANKPLEINQKKANHEAPLG